MKGGHMSDEQVTVKGLAKGLTLLIQAVREINDGQRQRIIIMDSQLRVLSELTDRLEALEARFGAACQVCARLNILCSDVGIDTKGPQNGKDRETLPNWIG
jgi:hypothetical protein